jgi:hypothetical protein
LLSIQILVFLPLLIWQLVVIKAERHIIAWFIGGLFMTMAVVLSVHDGTNMTLLLRDYPHRTAMPLLRFLGGMLQ